MNWKLAGSEGEKNAEFISKAFKTQLKPFEITKIT